MRSQTVSKLSTPTSTSIHKQTQSDSPYPRIFTPMNSFVTIEENTQRSLLPILDELEDNSIDQSPRRTSQFSQGENTPMQLEDFENTEVTERRVIDEKKLLDGIEEGINWEEAKKYSAIRVRESESGEQTVECTWSEFKMKALDSSEKSKRRDLGLVL